jgi:hypothetical protein
MNPIPSLSAFRDLPLKVELPPDLDRTVKMLDRPPASVSAQEEPGYIDAAIRTADQCVAYLDAEMHRLTEARFSLPDPAMLKQKLIGEPRRQADQLLNAVKTKLASEKQEWSRRVAKQMSDVLGTVDQQIETMQMTEQLEGHAFVAVPEAEWDRNFERWKAEVFSRWSRHLGQLLQSKTVQLLQPELDSLREVLGEPVVVHFPAPPAMEVIAAVGKETSDRFEIPTAMEICLEMFKGNLSTVAMIGGMVIIPVIGNFTDATPTHIRAAIMMGAVVPIVGFAIHRGRAERTKLLEQNRAKSLDKLKKGLAAEAKGELDRFKPDAERYAANYCNVALTAVLGVVEPMIARIFEYRERSAASELAKAQMTVERLQEKLNALRQVKTSLAGQVVVDLRRRQVELRSAGPIPAKA